MNIFSLLLLSRRRRKPVTPMARSADVTATTAAAGGKAQHLVHALVLKLPHTACANASAEGAPLYLCCSRAAGRSCWSAAA